MIHPRKSVLIFGLGLFTAACGPKETDLRAAGAVEGQVLTVRAAAGGRLEVWTAASGQLVRKGDVLGRIESAKLDTGLKDLDLAERETGLSESRAKNQIPALKAKVDFLKRQAERLERLRKDQAVSGGEIEKARLDLLGAETALADLEKWIAALAIEKDKIANKRRSMELALDDLVLRAPVDGLVQDSFVAAGEVLPAGAPAAEIMDTSALWADVFVETKEIAGLRLADAVAVRIDGGNGREWPGSIIQFGTAAEFSPKYTVSEKERAALLFRVRIGLPPEPKVFKLGMPVTVVFGRTAVKG